MPSRCVPRGPTVSLVPTASLRALLVVQLLVGYGFLEHVVLPHAAAFAWAIQVTELAAGLAAAACVALSVNFLAASGAGVPHPLAADSFDEGVSIDALLVGVQLAGYGLAALRLPVFGSYPAGLRGPSSTSSPSASSSRTTVSSPFTS